MDRSAIILVAGFQGTFSGDKGLLKLDNKHLLNRVVDAVKGIVDEVIIVTGSKKKADAYAEIFQSNARFVTDADASGEPLVAALTGFEAAEGKYSLLLLFDVPFVSRDVVSLLFELCIGKSAVIPRWPNSQIEPLHAVYHTKQAWEAAKKALANNELDMNALISKMQGVRYISTLVIEQLDPDLRTFFNINTPLDLKKAMTMIKPRKH